MIDARTIRETRARRLLKGEIGIRSSLPQLSMFDVLRVGANGSKTTDPYSQQATVYSCINAISKAVSAVPLFAVQGEDTAPRRIAGPWQEFFDKPNPILTRGQMWTATTIYLYTERGCKWVLMGKTGLRQKNEVPVEAWPVPARYFTALNSDRQIIQSWNRKPAYWQVIANDGNTDLERVFEAHQIADLKFFNPANPLTGFLPVDPARADIDGAYAAGVWNAEFFVRNCDPGGWMKVPAGKAATSDQKKQLEDNFRAQHEGPLKRGKTMFLYEGADFVPNNRTQKDMEFLEGQRFNREQICSVFGVPPAVLGLTQGVTFSNFRDSMRIFYDNTVSPLLSQIEDVIYEQIMRSSGDAWAKFDTSTVPAFQADYTERLQQATMIVAAGWTPDNANDRLSLGLPKSIDTTITIPALAGGDGAKEPATSVPLADLKQVAIDVSNGIYPASTAKAMILLSFPGTSEAMIDAVIGSVTPKTAKPESAPAAAEEPRGIVILSKRGPLKIRNRQEYVRMLWRELKPSERKLTAAVRKYLRTLSAAQLKLFRDWVQANGLGPDAVASLSAKDIDSIVFSRERWDAALRELTRPDIASIVETSLKNAANEAGAISIPMQDPRIAELIGKSMGSLIRTNATTQEVVRAQLMSASAQGETIAEMQARLVGATQLGNPRALLIARTETGIAANGARFTEFQDAQVERHEWLNSGFGERPSHRDKSSGGVGGEIVAVGEKFSNGLSYPLEFGASTDEVCNCRCTSAGVFE